ncbi:hypothetical protein E2C01_023085 [Portunus trituberculatus]|uniref:Uncharacterized protein n=1 Tax=Portunus trituberculatus TaxID=210409 RepID=A0A5B7EAL9_PORTR|nr:hypothetical protein [Portunus trituberculatus]
MPHPDFRDPREIAQVQIPWERDTVHSVLEAPAVCCGRVEMERVKTNSVSGRASPVNEASLIGVTFTECSVLVTLVDKGTRLFSCGT